VAKFEAAKDRKREKSYHPAGKINSGQHQWHGIGGKF
jgi:hypothetical protein